MREATFVFVYRCRNCGNKFDSTLMRLPRGETVLGALTGYVRRDEIVKHECDGLNYGLGELVGLRNELVGLRNEIK